VLLGIMTMKFDVILTVHRR